MSNFIKNERKRLNLKQSDVYKKIDVGSATYIRWESGKPIPSDKLFLLAEMGFDIHYVVTGNRATLNSKALQDCIEIIEEVSQETGRLFNPEQKAKLLVILYEDYITDAASITPEKINTYIRLVA